MREVEPLQLPLPCLVVLVGAAGAGKSTWAARSFSPGQVVSTDALRAMVGDGAHDLSATADAFALADTVVGHRLARRLTTVADSLGLDAGRRRAWVASAHRHQVPAVAVVLDVPAAEVRRRNRARAAAERVPDKVLSAQLARIAAERAVLGDDGFDAVHVITPAADGSLTPATTAPAALIAGVGPASPAVAAPPRPVPTGAHRDPHPRFGLQVPSYTWPGGPAEIGERLAAIASAAEVAGFESFWVMDHFRQIPLMGPPWHDMLDSYSALAFVAAATSTIRLGTLVTGITYRNIGHLAKIVATLDVLSGGRACCGLGLAWYEQEHTAYGWAFPDRSARYALLEDALQALPLLWGPGTPSFKGAAIEIPEAMCYPRPLQPRIPILVGGSGERRTLALVARHADACNLFGDVDVVARKRAVLHRHCEAVGRDPACVEVTQLATVLVGDDAAHVGALVEARRPRRLSAERYAVRVNAGTVEQHAARALRLAAAGVDTVIVSLDDLGEIEPIERFGRVIERVRSG